MPECRVFALDLDEIYRRSVETAVCWNIDVVLSLKVAIYTFVRDNSQMDENFLFRREE